MEKNFNWDDVYKEVRKDAAKTNEEFEEKKEIASFFITAVIILFFWVWFIFFR